ncbi:MAG: hypothetical protein QM601_12115 [Pseudoxanthomonas sp.]
MNIQRIIQVASIGAVLAFGATAVQAKNHGAGTPQTHHCKLTDGSTDASKTHKQCTAAKGTWTKDAASASAAVPAPAEPAAQAEPTTQAEPATPATH